MKTLYTYAFRDMARYCARVTGIAIEESWTDYRNRKDRDNERIVTFLVRNNPDRFVDRLGKLMELAGINAQSHGLRVTDTGYVKCNCVKPDLVKFY